MGFGSVVVAAIGKKSGIEEVMGRGWGMGDHAAGNGVGCGRVFGGDQMLLVLAVRTRGYTREQVQGSNAEMKR